MTEPYRIRSAETWAQARADYLSGMDAEAVCSRHDIGLSALRTRARREGWRRQDQDDPAPRETDLSVYDDVDLLDQIQMANRRYVQALDQGRATEAIRWRKLWSELKTAHRREEWPQVRTLTPAQVEARAQDIQARRDARGADDTATPSRNVHDVHSVFSSAHSVAADPPQNRAERRSLAAETATQRVDPVLLPPATGKGFER